jgi:signal transduction histidine kinase
VRATGLTAAPAATGSLPLGLMILAGPAILATSQPWYVQNLGLRAAAETVITGCAIVGATLLFLRFRRTRRARDLMLLAALMTVAGADIPGSILPAMVGGDALGPATFVNLIAQTLVALAFAAAAITPSAKRIKWRTRTLASVGLAATALIALAQIVTFSAASGSPAIDATSMSGVATDHPAALALRLVAIVLLAAAAIVFVRRSDYQHDDPQLLALAAVLLAGARAQSLVLPTIAPSWVTPGSGLRVVAYGLMLAFAVRQHARTRGEAADAAMRAERERIARDLHDGIAQDLAFIAAHRQRLTSELGAEHPVVIAASRALAASRGKMVDLAASAAPTAAIALHEVAEEIEARFGVQVAVQADKAEHLDLGVAERDDLVRIAREAMVNAVKHGGAKKITVELGAKDTEVMLRVSDDGRGISEHPKKCSTATGGFGMPAMRARATAIGGRLVATGGRHGGTEVKVVRA